MTRREFDETDVRVRPNRRGSRPRTKTRPLHEDAVSGTVAAVDRGRLTVWLDTPSAPVTAMKARELGRAGIVVGDRVDLVGDITGAPGTLARIVRVAPRATVLRRSADDVDPTERIIVANADQLVIVTALADPQPRPRMIDRCLVAAYDAGMEPLLCLTKADLADPAEFLAIYRPLGIAAVWTAFSDGHIDGIDRLHGALAGRTSALVGHSGVGKSTLVNHLVPTADRATGRVNDVTGRGRHTSSSAMMFDVRAAEGFAEARIIDTPGVRSFGLGHVAAQRVIAAFPDLAEVADRCPRGCLHDADAPDCELDEWAQADLARTARVESYRRLLSARAETTVAG